MTRYKTELRKHGFKLEQDYPWLPYEQGNIAIEGVRVKIDNSLIVICTDYNVGTGIEFIDRNFSVVDRDFY